MNSSFSDSYGVCKCFILCSKTSQVTIFINIMDDSLSYSCTCNNGCILFLCCFIFLFHIKLYGKRGWGGGATTLFWLSSVANVFDDPDFGYSTIEHSLPRLHVPTTCLYLHAMHV